MLSEQPMRLERKGETPLTLSIVDISQGSTWEQPLPLKRTTVGDGSPLQRFIIFFYVVLIIEVRASRIPGENSITELCLQLRLHNFKVILLHVIYVDVLPACMSVCLMHS